MIELEEYIKQQQLEQDNYTPVFYRLGNQKEYDALLTLLTSQPNIRVYDQIHSQLSELMKIRNPTKRLTAAESEQLLTEFVGTASLLTVGVWVYYPWTNRVVHILDEKEFIELRTSRNKQKITDEEAEILRTKKIGVIGLSVGQSIALTLAMERICGELRLADFDTLELSNMNRIRTSIHNINQSKVVIAAREIAELDPFIKIVCYTQGATEENLLDFMTLNGKLDILVEECDGIDIKIISRMKAKALSIPVVMEMNDRGMLDIERYDLEPELPLLHGLIPKIDIATLQNLTNEEKVPILGPMVGMNDMSPKMKFSLTEIGKSITTWPQLASSVVLGGALVADTCRRIILDQLRSSGRYYVDFEQLIK
ncbi:ThiF family adenylyltransferase [Chitinophaga sp. CF118]|uniref:ThiF family adenylyltransferase n=1 Tax=Chitinophaga sp. CF118 TaxID=1884367 RepID=UPI0021014B38|nr:ThiF family adenylyltransferase [Chitinophaga sp. CF118]